MSDTKCISLFQKVIYTLNHQAMDPPSPDPIPNWTGREVIDILSHHVCPSLWLNRDPLVCRLVCRSWRDAFVPRAITVRHHLCDETQSAEDVARSITMARKATQITVDITKVPMDIEASTLLDWFHTQIIQGDANSAASSLVSLTIYVRRMEITDANIVVQILTSRRLPRLHHFKLCTIWTPADNAVIAIANALAVTEAPLQEINLRLFPFNRLMGAELFSALIRGPKTLRTLRVDNNDVGWSGLDELCNFISNNGRVTKLIASGFRAGPEEDCSKLMRVLESNTMLEHMDPFGCDHRIFSSFCLSLRKNRKLRKLVVGSYTLSMISLSFLIDCLIDNNSIQHLELETEESIDAASQLRRLFDGQNSLKFFRLAYRQGTNEDFSYMFQGGLRRNSTLTHLEVSGVRGNFFLSLADCIMDGGLVNLEKLVCSNSNMSDASARRLSAALVCLPRFSTFNLSDADCGPDAVEPFAEFIEKSPNLQSVVLDDVPVDSAGLIRICDAVLKSSSPIRELTLCGEDATDELVLSLCNMIAKKTSLESVDLSGITIPPTFRPDLEAALMQNDKIYCLELDFPIENSKHGASFDLKEEMVQKFLQPISSSSNAAQR